MICNYITGTQNASMQSNNSGDDSTRPRDPQTGAEGEGGRGPGAEETLSTSQRPSPRSTSDDKKERVTAALVLRELRTHNFAVLSTVGENREPDSAGVNYGVSAPGPGRELALYVMTRRHLKKARNIARNSGVSLVVPLPRRILQFVPPATIQLRGRAEILDWTDKEGREVFRRFWMGRRILSAYEESRKRGETRVCFLKIIIEPLIHTYAVGYSAWDLRHNMESAAAKVYLQAKQQAPGVGPAVGLP